MNEHTFPTIWMRVFFAGLALMLFACVLSGCTSLTVRDMSIEAPPIPAELLQPCEEPGPLPDGSLSTLYQQQFRDLAAWARCIKKDDALLAVLKYRDAFVAKLKADNAAKPKPWFQFW